MSWVRFRFKGNKVYARVDEAGEPVVHDGRVEIRYKPEDATSYRAAASRLQPLDAPDQTPGQEAKVGKGPNQTRRKERRGKAAGKKPAPSVEAETPDPDTVIAYTDGACSGNPGPAGWGVVLRYGEHFKELSGYLGHATNNIAELWAIKEVLLAVKDSNKPLWIHTDSTYAVGILTQGWKPRANKELVLEIRSLLERFSNARFIKVLAHSGVPDNERADALAVAATKEAR